ncbi:MAG: ABC transporter ATP-binding protein [Patescibacteria group bacterium]
MSKNDIILTIIVLHKGNVMQKIKDFFKILYENYSPFAGKATVVFVLLTIGQLMFLSLPYFQGKIFDNLASKALFVDSLYLGLAILAVYLVSNVINNIREKYEVKHLTLELQARAGEKALEELFGFSLGQHINENSGLRSTVINRGVSAMGNFLNGFIYSLLPFLTQIIFASVAIIFVNWTLGVVVLSFAIVYLAIQFRFNANFYPRFSENRRKWNDQSKHQSEILRNVKLVKMSGKEAEMVKEYREHWDEVANPTKTMWTDYIGAYYARDTLVSFGQVAALLAGVWLVSTGVESPGKIVMLIGWMGSVFGNVGSLGWIQRNMLQQLADINKLHEMLSREPAVKAPENPVLLPEIGGKIEFRDVSFAYPIESVENKESGESETENAENGEPVNKEVLKNVSFAIEKGETVAIVGSSGAGKTTIVNLLFRGYDPDEGEILVDGINLRDIDMDSYVEKAGFVPQVVQMFDNTLKYNLTFGVKHPEKITEAELEEVARKARIDQFYDRLGEKKFDVLIGENGIKLSGGERQRVGIARALLKKPEILIFDEATSNLDALNEALIHEAMREALRGRTGIIIAHRFSTIRDADKIIVIDGGTIVGMGKHRELLKWCEPYRKLVKHQIVAF